MRAALALLALLVLAPAAGAQTWSAPQPLSSEHALVDAPRLAVSAEGPALAAWTYADEGRGGYSLAARGPGAAAFGRARALAPRSRLATVPSVEGPVAFGRKGALVAVARVRRIGVRTGGADGRFGRERVVRRIGRGRIGEAALAANGNGEAALVWFEDRGTRTDRVYVSLRRAGGRFGPPRRLATGAIRRVAVAVGGAGDVLVAWNSPGKVLTRFLARRTRTFRAVQRIRSRPAYFAQLRPVVALNGRAAIAWSAQAQSEGGDTGPAYFEAALRPFGAKRFRRARLLERLPAEPMPRDVDAVATGASGLVVAWTGLGGSVRVAAVDGEPQTVSPPEAVLADLAADDTGRLVAVWAESDRIGAAFAEPGAPFGAPEPVVDGSLAAAAFDPRTHAPTVVAGGGGRIVATTRSG